MDSNVLIENKRQTLTEYCPSRTQDRFVFILWNYCVRSKCVLCTHSTISSIITIRFILHTIHIIIIIIILIMNCKSKFGITNKTHKNCSFLFEGVVVIIIDVIVHYSSIARMMFFSFRHCSSVVFASIAKLSIAFVIHHDSIYLTLD